MQVIYLDDDEGFGSNRHENAFNMFILITTIVDLILSLFIVIDAHHVCSFARPRSEESLRTEDCVGVEIMRYPGIYIIYFYVPLPIYMLKFGIHLGRNFMIRKSHHRTPGTPESRSLHGTPWFFSLEGESILFANQAQYQIMSCLAFSFPSFGVFLSDSFGNLSDSFRFGFRGFELWRGLMDQDWPPLWCLHRYVGSMLR